MTLKTYFPGETMRLSAKSLNHSDSGSVTAGAMVTITLLNPDGTQHDEQIATTGGSGDDWFVDIDAPATPGEYAVKMVATVSGAVWKGKNAIRVNAF
jgi:hypothetical protein